jgi:hypothetical protein
MENCSPKTNTGQVLKEEMLRECNKIFEKVFENRNFNAASLLDPRYKLEFLKNLEISSRTVERVNRMLKTLPSQPKEEIPVNNK